MAKFVTISARFDEDMAERLQKEPNASDILRMLVGDYYEDKILSPSEQGKKRLKELEVRARAIELERIERIQLDKNAIAEREGIDLEVALIIKENNERLKKEKDINKIIPSKVIHELREFPKMTIHDLQARFNEHYRDNYDFTFSELKEALELIKS